MFCISLSLHMNEIIRSTVSSVAYLVVCTTRRTFSFSNVIGCYWIDTKYVSWKSKSFRVKSKGISFGTWVHTSTMYQIKHTFVSHVQCHLKRIQYTEDQWTNSNFNFLLHLFSLLLQVQKQVGHLICRSMTNIHCLDIDNKFKFGLKMIWLKMQRLGLHTL